MTATQSKPKRYAIHINGKTYRFATFKAASSCAARVYDATGIFVGIYEIR